MFVRWKRQPVGRRCMTWPPNERVLYAALFESQHVGGKTRQRMVRCLAAIRGGQVARVRYAAPERVPDTIRTAAAEALQYVADAPVSMHGRVELLWYLREQSISHVYHRYGNLGRRALVAPASGRGSRMVALAEEPPGRARG